MKTVFVDGYNVINGWSDLRSIQNYELDAARQKLIDILQNYATYKGEKIIIVFDAHMVKGSLEKKERIGSLMVVFTKEGETADHYIEKSVDSIGRKSDVTVVTSDSLEQMVAFQRGATRMSTLEFYHEIKKIEARIRTKSVREYSEKRTLLEERIQDEIREKLEKMRKGK